MDKNFLRALNIARELGLHCGFLFFLCFNILSAQDKVQAEKIKFQLSNTLLHPLIQNNDKSTTEIEIIIPSIEPSAKSWNFRAWETAHPMKEALELLAVGISYQITAFIISGETYQNADKTQREALLKLTKEYKIQLIIKSATFGLPIKKNDLDDLDDFASIRGADILICINNNVNLSPEKTIDYFKKILDPIKNKEKKIYCEAFSKDDNYLQALQQIKDPRIIPVFNWTKRVWSLTAPLNPLIGKYEDSSAIRMNASLENFGNNEILALLQDYIGYRQTQCMEASKNIQGFIMDFGSSMTCFGSINAVNIYTMSELLLNRDKDMDIINNNWFTAQYGHKEGQEIFNITAGSTNILRQVLYANNSSEIEYTKSLTPIALTQLLSSGSLDSWCKLKKAKTFRNCSLFKEKLQAKEAVEVLEKNYKAFIANKKSADTEITLNQILSTKEMVSMMFDYTGLFLQAQFEPLETNQLNNLKSYSKKFPAIENSIQDLKAIYIDKKADSLEAIPQENLPSYLQKK